MKFVCAVFLLGLIACLPSHQVEGLAKGAFYTIDNKVIQKDSLSAFITQQMRAENIPALSIAIVKDTGLVHEQVFGVKDLDTKAPILPNTLFEAASLSKPVFAYLVLQLVKEDKLDLDRPLFEYFPYPDIAEDERYKKITARMALSHTAGFPNWRRNNPLSILFTPGDQFSYSGEGYMYLQKVVEKLLEAELSSLIDTYVFQPLNMKNSYFKWDDALMDNLAMGYDRQGQQKKKWKPTEALAAGSLHTTATDYAKFLAFIMQDVHFMQHMSQPETKIAGFAGTLGWGLGLGWQQSGARSSFWHWGSNDGYKSFILAYPNEKLALVYMTNSDHGLNLLDDLSCQLFGGPYPALDWLHQEHDYPIQGKCE